MSRSESRIISKLNNLIIDIDTNRQLLRSYEIRPNFLENFITLDSLPTFEINNNLYQKLQNTLNLVTTLIKTFELEEKRRSIILELESIRENQIIQGRAREHRSQRRRQILPYRERSPLPYREQEHQN